MNNEQNRPELESTPHGDPLLEETASQTKEMLPLVVKGRLDDWQVLDGERWPDPEVAWKKREKELREWFDRNPASDRSDPVPSPPSRPTPAYRPEGSRTPPAAPGRDGPAWLRTLRNQTLAALLLYALLWVMHESNAPWALKGRALTAEALTQDMAFQRVAAWYENTFSGAPSLIPAFGDHAKGDATKVTAPLARFLQPVKGKIVTPFSSRLQGVVIETVPGAKAVAMDAGRVEFAGQRQDTGYTVVVRHAGGYSTTYGFLVPAAWEPGEWVKAGDLIGETEQNRLFLAMMKDQKYLDPTQAVSFD